MKVIQEKLLFKGYFEIIHREKSMDKKPKTKVMQPNVLNLLAELYKDLKINEQSYSLINVLFFHEFVFHSD